MFEILKKKKTLLSTWQRVTWGLGFLLCFVFYVEQEDEIKREAEARRKEKQEDILARKKILEQIERDKEERRKRLLQSTTTTTTSSNAAAAAPKSTTSGQNKPNVAGTNPVAKDYNEAKIQIRFV